MKRTAATAVLALAAAFPPATVHAQDAAPVAFPFR